ncbi:MAG: dihydrofolate reductase family protein [Methanomicrobiales archaeon]|jgi:2,5-diamino-6-(ribosylamino)-4(3H)-pyrimidinone 5'-phosphate reductase|nr:dihydrofolate reductase family protein [Methanomicrobiales archaeon]
MSSAERADRPTVLIVSEVTVDGRLTIHPGCSSKELMQFMSHEAEVFLHKIRAECDAIMVGANTIRIDNSYLTVRHVPGKNPIRVVPTARCSLSPQANVFSSDAKTIIATTKQAPKEAICALEEVGAEVISVGERKVELRILLERLYAEYGVQKLMLEGGSSLNGQMFSLGLVDHVLLIHMPFIVGGVDTPSFVGAFSSTNIHDMVRLQLDNSYMCGSNLITEYTVLQNDAI